MDIRPDIHNKSEEILTNNFPYIYTDYFVYFSRFSNFAKKLLTIENIKVKIHPKFEKSHKKNILQF